MKLTRTRIILLVIVAFIALFFTFGVKIDLGEGELRIGKQDDLTVSQRADVENSHFYREYFENDALVVLNYWATWCKPCIAEMPELNEVKRQYEGENIAFISLSVDTDSIKLANFLASKKFEFTDITLENRAYRTAILNTLRGRAPDKWIGSYSVPITYIIKNRKVLETVNGTVEKEELVAMIERHR